MVRVTGLTKRYGRALALDNLSLAVPQGAVFGLLGPNGSGKSTLIKLLLGFIFPDAGTIDLGGLTAGQMGYLAERPFLPPRMGIEEYLVTVGRLGGLEGQKLRAAVAGRLELVGLHGVAGRRINTCSRGMLQRLALATSLLDDAPLLLWDEPMGGLDPAWQKAVRDLIGELAGAGKTILLSTHDLSEVEQVCSHVAIMYRGKLMRCGPLNEVLATRPSVRIAVDRLPAATRTALAELHPDVAIQGTSLVLTGDAIAFKADVLRSLLAAGLDIEALVHERPTLEEVYLEAIRS